MTSGQKITFSLLFSMLIFAAFVVFANVRLFSELENRFYSGAKVSEKKNHLNQVSESFDAYISNFLTQAADYSKNHYISSYLEQNPSEKIVSERRRLTEKLFNDFPPLQGIRIIDRNGRNVHYSSFDSTDLLRQNGISKIYKNYYDIQKDCDEIDFNRLRVNSLFKIFVDAEKHRLIVSLPFYLFGNVQAGIMLCYLNLYEIREELTANNIIGYGENFAIFSDDSYRGGFVLGIPLNSVSEFRDSVLESFDKGGYNQPQKILTASDGSYWTLLSAESSRYINISGAYASKVFELSDDLIRLIYVSVFITLFLFVYLLFSLRGEPLATTRKKISQLQAGIIEEYLSRRQDVDWTKMAEVLRLRKSDFVDRLRNDLAKKSRRHAGEVNELLEHAWNDIITIFEKYEKNDSAVNSPALQNAAFSVSELRAMIEDVLKSSKINVVQQLPPHYDKEQDEVGDLEEVPGELDEVADLEEVPGELDEVSDLEEVPGELDEVSDLEEAPAELDEVSDLEEVPGELDEVSDLEEVPAELDEVGDLKEEPGELDEVSELEEEPAELDEVSDLEEVPGELDEVGDLEEVPAELDEVGDLEEEPAELDEVSDLEEVPGELDEVADLEETPDELDKVGDLEEEPGELDEVADLEEVPGDVDEVADLEEVPGELDEVSDLEEKPAALDEVAELEEEPGELDEVSDLEEVPGELDEVSDLEEEPAELDEVSDLEEEPAELDEVSDLEEETGEIEELPEYDEFPGEKKHNYAGEDQKKTFYDVDNLLPGRDEYFEDSESFIRSEVFASVENLFAEEIALGTEYDFFKNKHQSDVMKFEIHRLSEMSDEEIPLLDDAENIDMSEKVEPASRQAKPYFAMTDFGSNLDGIAELELVKEYKKAEAAEVIKENDGVFQISDDLDYSSENLDSKFKSLVDSVLHK